MSDSFKTARQQPSKTPGMTPSLAGLTKLTTLLVVDSIEACLPTWQALGFEITVRVPDAGTLDFVILNDGRKELMLQTTSSLKDDLPDVAALKPAFVLYADVNSLERARKTLSSARTLVQERKTFYGATESWLVLPGNVVIGLAQH